jgi:hypothetical protein
MPGLGGGGLPGSLGFGTWVAKYMRPKTMSAKSMSRRVRSGKRRKCKLLDSHLERRLSALAGSTSIGGVRG